MTALEIYDDLKNIDIGENLVKLQETNQNLLDHIAKLEGDIQKLCNELTKMKTAEQTLKKNISELFNTAKVEVERKDRRIAELQRELDNMIFKRRFNRNTNVACDNKPTLNLDDAIEVEDKQPDASIFKRKFNPTTNVAGDIKPTWNLNDDVKVEVKEEDDKRSKSKSNSKERFGSPKEARYRCQSPSRNKYESQYSSRKRGRSSSRSRERNYKHGKNGRDNQVRRHSHSRSKSREKLKYNRIQTVIRIGDSKQCLNDTRKNGNRFQADCGAERRIRDEGTNRMSKVKSQILSRDAEPSRTKRENLVSSSYDNRMAQDNGNNRRPLIHAARRRRCAGIKLVN